MPVDQEPAGESAGDGVSAGIEQFQKAALEALAAARAMIDAAETIVSEPKAVESLLGTIGDAARSATHTVAGFAAGAARAAHARDQDHGDDTGDGGFEHIDVD